jgi:hypothetical protein
MIVQVMILNRQERESAEFLCMTPKILAQGGVLAARDGGGSTVWNIRGTR